MLDARPRAETERERPHEVLVVEDSPTQSAYLAHVLEEAGYRVRTAASGEEALDRLAAARPDLVVSDVLMPGMDGFALCEAIRADPDLADLPLILLTTLSEPAELLRALAVGADSFLTKSRETDVLLSRIRDVLDPAPDDGGEAPLDIRIDGREYRVAADRRRIMDFFLAAYRVALTKQREAREAEESMRRQAEELERSNEELQRFAYVASHDLQEPLRSIVSFSQLLERRYRGRLDAEADEYIAFITRGGERMQQLILDLLAFSRVSTRGASFVPTDANEVLREVLATLRGLVEAAEADVEIEPLPAVLADPGQLEQVFSNLLSNALKFRGATPSRIRVAGEREGAWARISVSDNGIGIEPDYFDRIFVLFQRLHTQEAYPGTGIGLAIVQKIVERHGGRVWVESTPGRGSTFVFTLPAA